MRHKNVSRIPGILAGGLILCLLLITATVAQHVSAASPQYRSQTQSVHCPAPLYPGNRGEWAKKVQQRLNGLYRFGALNNAPYDFQAPIAIDGVYEADTVNAIKDLQAANNLLVNGVIDEETWGALGICPNGEPAP